MSVTVGNPNISSTNLSGRIRRNVMDTRRAVSFMILLASVMVPATALVIGTFIADPLINKAFCSDNTLLVGVFGQLLLWNINQPRLFSLHDIIA